MSYLDVKINYLDVKRFAVKWDPEQYARYSDERSRPFVDLLAQVGATDPRRVCDLGCGPGPLTELLASRWPAALVEGVDSSEEMIARARPLSTDRLSFTLADAGGWTPGADCDVLISNALLQWVPDHLDVLSRWAAALPSGAWLAFQVPGNFGSPSHVSIRRLATSPRWAAQVGTLYRGEDTVASPSSYAALLAAAGFTVNVWETTYLHVLSGPDPVLEWVRGTGLRPVLAALSPQEGTVFAESLAEMLRSEYPQGADGTTLFPFRRIFAVGRKN